VFNGRDGFLGIREKFENRFVDKEFHWDTGAPYGTARPLEDLGTDLPEGILLEHYIDFTTTRPIEKGREGWQFKDTRKEALNIRHVSIHNQALHDWLEEQETKLCRKE
jgi:hypothetical protein